MRPYTAQWSRPEKWCSECLPLRLLPPLPARRLQPELPEPAHKPSGRGSGNRSSASPWQPWSDLLQSRTLPRDWSWQGYPWGPGYQPQQCSCQTQRSCHRHPEVPSLSGIRSNQPRYVHQPLPYASYPESRTRQLPWQPSRYLPQSSLCRKW